MDIDVKPCASTEDLRDALNVISHYFGHENTDEDAERFANWIEVDRMHAARADGKIVGGAGAFTYRMSVPGGGSVSAGGVTVVGVLPTHRRPGVAHRCRRPAARAHTFGAAVRVTRHGAAARPGGSGEGVSGAL